jgi:ACS family hexuronate transporter-like MFS transporter
MSESEIGNTQKHEKNFAIAPAMGRVRWTICAMLFVATSINYMDRQVIGLLKPTLQQQYGWSELDYGDIVLAFQLAYAIGFIVAGRLVDRLGTKKGFTLALGIWSIAALAHAETTRYGAAASSLLAVIGLKYSASVAGFIVARFALDLGESGNFPAALKAVAEWFPQRERALATGIFNAGTNVGALVTPIVVPWITIRYGWYWAFIATGALGFLWLLAWWSMYDSPGRHASVSPAEFAHITSDPVEPTTKMSWERFFHIGRPGRSPLVVLTDPVRWRYLFWIRTFSSELRAELDDDGAADRRDLSDRRRGQRRADMSSTLIKRGWTVFVRADGDVSARSP